MNLQKLQKRRSSYNGHTLIEQREKLLKLGISLARTKLGKRASTTAIHDELINSNQPFIRKTAITIKKIHDNIPDRMAWQKSVISEVGEFVLWCTIHHPKYRILF